MFGRRAKPMSAEEADRLLRRPEVPPNTLRRILYRAPEPYNARAWKRIVATEQPSAWRGILYSAPAVYRAKAADRMIRAGEGLATILVHAPAASRRKAARVLLAKRVTGPELRKIVWFVAEPFRRRAWDRLCAEVALRIDARDLARRMLTAGRIPKQYRTEAAEFLITHGNGRDLSEVVQHALEPQKTIAARTQSAERDRWEELARTGLLFPDIHDRRIAGLLANDDD